MTDSKKTEKGKKQPKAKGLQLNKETLKDLSAPGGGQVKGGRVSPQQRKNKTYTG